MEELHSTDAIDEEIRSDARKKAQRILEKADEEAQKIFDGVNARVAESVEKAKNASEQRMKLYEKNVSAAVPLEKQRYLINYIDGAVVSAINDYTKSLSEDRKLDVVKTMAAGSKSLLGGRSVHVYSIGLDENKSASMLNALCGCQVTECKKVQQNDRLVAGYLDDTAIAKYECRDGLVIKADDGSFACRFTVAEKIKNIMDSKRMELSVSLFGGRLPE